MSEPRTSTEDWQPRKFPKIKLAEFVGGPACGKRWDLPNPPPLKVLVPCNNGGAHLYNITKRLTVDGEAVIYA